MSNFENEYKKYSEESTPDLWARIEEGIDAYEASESTQSTDNKVIDMRTRNRNKSIAIGLIAVAACLLICIPAIRRTSKDTADRLEAADTGSYKDVAEAEAPMEAAAEAEVMEEAPAAEVMEEAAVDVAEEPASVEEAAAAETEEAAEAPKQAEAAKATDSVTAAWEFEDESMVRFSFNEPVSEFKVLAIEVTDVTEEGKLVYNSSVSFDGGSYDAGEALVIEVIFMGDIPNNAISYKDSDGTEHILFVSVSGRDGSVTLSEN